MFLIGVVACSRGYSRIKQDAQHRNEHEHLSYRMFLGWASPHGYRRPEEARVFTVRRVPSRTVRFPKNDFGDRIFVNFKLKLAVT